MVELCPHSARERAEPETIHLPGSALKTYPDPPCFYAELDPALAIDTAKKLG